MNERPWLKNYDPEVLHHLEYPAITVPDLFEMTTFQFPEKTCAIYDGIRISYQEMQDWIDRLAHKLVTLGLKKGDRAGLLMPNMPQFILSYFAILKAGAIVVAINPLYKEQEIIRQVNDAGIKIMIAISSLYPVVKALQPATKIQTLIITNTKEGFLSKTRMAGSELILAPGDFWLGALVQTEPDNSQSLPEVTPGDDALFQYSGGTTGISKAAIATHKNLVANALQFSAWMHVSQPGHETVLLAIPMFHVYGMVVGMLFAIRIGAAIVLIPNARDTQQTLHAIQEHHASFFPGVPTLFTAINHHPDVLAGKYDLSTIKACISGSAPLLAETKFVFEKLTGGKLVEGYGLSEAPTATHCNPLFNENRSGSIGLPLPDVDCRVVSLEDGVTNMPPGEPGELILSSPQVMRGYHNMPDETAQTLHDGWLYTGDIVIMDSEGYFYIVDRKKELIKPGGFQVWPREVEEVIIMHPKVMEVAVAGIPDAYRGEAVKAWVVLKPDEHAEESEIIEFCKKRLASYKAPVQVAFRSELPRTTVGKILRRLLVQDHLAGK
jgi:long-chain acyl-CoA synthetase